MSLRWVLLFALLFTGKVLAESAQGPDLELICPCNYSAASSSSVNVSVGVLNRADVATGELILRAYAHTTKSYFDSDDREFLGELTLNFIDSHIVRSGFGVSSGLRPCFIPRIVESCIIAQKLHHSQG